MNATPRARKRVVFTPIPRGALPERVQRLRRLAARGEVNGRRVRELTSPEFSNVGLHSFVVEKGPSKKYLNFSSYKWPEHDKEHGVIFAMQDRVHFYPTPYSFWSMLVDHGMATRIRTKPIGNVSLEGWRTLIQNGGVNSASSIREMNTALAVHFKSVYSFQRGVQSMFNDSVMRPHLDFLGQLVLPANTLYATFPPEKVREATPHLLAVFDFLCSKRRAKKN